LLGVDLQAFDFLAHLCAPDAREREEKALISREAVDRSRLWLASKRAAIRLVRDLQSAEIAERFAKHLLPVMVQPPAYVERVELIDHT